MKTEDFEQFLLKILPPQNIVARKSCFYLNMIEVFSLHAFSAFYYSNFQIYCHGD